jgi:hypothetical protein
MMQPMVAFIVVRLRCAAYLTQVIETGIARLLGVLSIDNSAIEEHVDNSLGKLVQK